MNSSHVEITFFNLGINFQACIFIANGITEIKVSQ